MRKPIVAGNWKMNNTTAEAVELAAEIDRRVGVLDDVEVVVCPPFTALESVRCRIGDGKLALGAQNVHWQAAGAYTGEISASMLRELDCTYVIVGHSERRTHFGETDREINRKARAVLAAGMRPILCFGETQEQRETGCTEDVVREQVSRGIDGIEDSLDAAVIAYEPVWAIGTGRTATAGQAQEVHALIRGLIRDLAGDAAADGLRIQYGGSVKPDNAGELFGQPDVDGGLIGGASLDADSFARIVESAR
jgi:triosephosphate isomerase